MTQFHALTVADRRRETDAAVSIAFAVPEALRDAFAFTPGQYLTLRTTLDGREERRSYSICSGLDDGELRIAIKCLPGGRFSAWAHAALQAGACVEVLPPEGRFMLPAEAGQVYAGFAAGSGITPVMSILKSVLTRQADSRFFLFYGNRGRSDIIFRAALDDLKDRFMNRLSVVHVLSREHQDSPVLHGRLDGAKLRQLLDGVVPAAAIDAAFVCGPAGMIETVTEALVAAGVPDGRIRAERFTASGSPAPEPAPAPGADAAAVVATIIVHGGRTEVPVKPGEAVLDAALRAGLDLPWSCRDGICSTCRAKLVEGSAEMARNFALEPWETDEGFILTCQARPTSARLTVDYDAV